MTFHLRRVIIFSSVWVAEWPPFWKYNVGAHLVDHIFSLYFGCGFSYFQFWF